MQINYLAVLIATVVQFALGFVWFGPLFGKLWGKIHGFDKLPKEEQQRLMKSMGPYYGLQALVTLITSFVLSLFVTYLPLWNPYALAGFFWIGFVVPTQISGVIFSRTERKWQLAQMLVLAGGSLLSLEAAAAVIRFLL